MQPVGGGLHSYKVKKSWVGQTEVLWWCRHFKLKEEAGWWRVGNTRDARERTNQS